MDLVLPKKIEQPAQLSDAQPFDKIDMLADGRIGLVGESRREDELDAGSARRVRHAPRVNAVARDDPENFRRLQVMPVRLGLDLSRDGGDV